MSLDPFFPNISAESAPPASVPLQAQRDEIARELHHRRQSGDHAVSKGWMTVEQKDAEIDAIAACLATAEWRLSLSRLYGPDPRAAKWEGSDADEARMERYMIGAHAVPWHTKVDCLRREILRRRKYYPGKVRKGTLDPTIARHQLERIEAFHLYLWRDSVEIWPAELEHLRDLVATDPAARRTMSIAWADHRGRFDPDPAAHARGLYLGAPAEQEPSLDFA